MTKKIERGLSAFYLFGYLSLMFIVVYKKGIHI